MIVFITNRKHDITASDISVVNTLDPVIKYLENLELIGFDKEFNGLNELYTIPLLTAIGDQYHQFIIDDTSIDLSPLKQFEDKTFIGHNIKIDIKVARFHQNLNFRKLYDTMIAEQRLGLGSGRPNDLESVYLRRTNKVLPESKLTRNQFTKMNKSSIFNNDHIRYAASDVEVLFAIHEEQKRLIDKFNYHHLLFNIEFPLIPLLADAELEGFELNEPLWKKNIERNKKEKLRLERAMDFELANLKVFRNSKRREVQEVTQTSLFPSLVEEKTTANLNKGHINYNSTQQVLNVFDILNLPQPKTEVKETNRITKVKEKSLKPGIGEDHLNEYLLAKPKTPLRGFIELLLDYKSHCKMLSSFGQRFLVTEFKNQTGTRMLGFKNAITNKVHTSYRQCMSKTGRLQSGDANIGFYNSQQIPAESIKEGNERVAVYRVPFTLSQEEIDDDWWITTADLTGAESVIMCAFAKDAQLYKWAVEEDDLHSPMSTKCYRALFEYRKTKKRPQKIKDSYGKEYPLTADIVIDKMNNKEIRNDYKRVGFGGVYGAQAGTIAKTLNLPKDEGKIILDVMESTIPDTFKMVKEAAAFAVVNGYVVHNKRTNSRKYFPPIIKGNPSREELAMVQQEARNCRIQGTQADLLKEAMVNIDKYFKEHNIPNCLLLQVHDELVWKHKGKENGQHVARIMAETGTLYLEGFTEMKADYDTLHTWTK